MDNTTNENYTSDYEQLTETQRAYIRREVMKGYRQLIEGKGRPFDEFAAEMRKVRYTNT